MALLVRIGLLWVVFGVSLPMRLYGQTQPIQVETNLGVELVNALMVQISPEFLPDSAANPQLFRTTRLMRVSYMYFAPFRQHMAVVRTRQLTDKLGTGVYLLPLFYSGFPKPVRHTAVSPPLLEAIHPHPDSAARLADEYMQVLGKFYREAQFARFQRTHRSTYNLALAEVRRNLPAANFIPTMERYYGARNAGYHIIINPFFKAQWGMAWQVPTAAGPVSYQIAAPFQEQVLQRGRTRAAGFDNAEAVRNLSVHEFGHTFINPLTAQPDLARAIEAHKALFRPIPGMGQYSDWETSFNEHLVRAGEVRLALALGRPEVSTHLRTEYRDWMYLPFFEQQLQLYEANRTRYPTLASFLPELISALPRLTP
ncbi:hypothetical protein GCM10027346_19370 [Hymenobacter seoulensis]